MKVRFMVAAACLLAGAAHAECTGTWQDKAGHDDGDVVLVTAMTEGAMSDGSAMWGPIKDSIGLGYNLDVIDDTNWPGDRMLATGQIYEYGTHGPVNVRRSVFFDLTCPGLTKARM